MGWQCKCPQVTSAYEYDPAIYKFREILREYSLIGYHCTKLTTEEINDVHENGLLLQDSLSLKKRISRLEETSLIDSDVSQALASKNQADASNRANMLWFCFYEPFLAGQHGIERFFRSWGGEALYNYHEGNPVTGKAISSVGTACVIKAKVPIESFKDSYYPDTSMIRVFLSNRGHKLDNDIEHEAFSTKKVGPQNILEIFEHPSEGFIALTKCDEWSSCDEAL